MSLRRGRGGTLALSLGEAASAGGVSVEQAEMLWDEHQSDRNVPEEGCPF